MMANVSRKGEPSSKVQMRIVLLGFRNAGKSSAGNTILQRPAFGSRRGPECVVQQGQVSGRPLTVVEAPGWSVGPAEDSTELLKQEIVRSPSLCPPGPHVLLIVVPVNTSFSEAHGTSVMEHMELLGAQVWCYAMVLFTAGDYLGNLTIEHHIECEGGAIQWLLKKCGNRYHVLNNKCRDSTQVTELLKKIQEMVDGNEDQHYNVDINILEAEEWKKKVTERARDRRTEVQNNREKIREQMGDEQKAPELRLVLMEHGARGKSSAGNLILGRKESDGSSSAECVKGQAVVSGRPMTLVQVPRWCRNRQITQSSRLLQQEIALSVSMCPPGPHAILLILPTDVAFKEDDRRVIEQHVECVGERVWSHVMVLFTSGNYLGDTQIELHIESEGGPLRRLLQKCHNRYHVLNTESAEALQVRHLLDKVDAMVAENHHYELDREILKDVEEKKRNADKRAHRRKQNVHKHRELLRSQIGGRRLSELRLVLLGAAGKSSAGNIILGRDAFELKRVVESEIKQQMVAGRKVTVVETPCWSDSDLQNTAKMYQLEFRRSLYLCRPGPHALLLVFSIDSKYSEVNNRVVEQHLKLFSPTAWNHTIVLFTHEDELGHTPIELYIESEGGALQWLLEKCRNRYHVLNNKVERDDKQVMQLFEKIEEMMKENNDCYYQIDQTIIDAMNERTRVVKKAKERELKTQRKREETRGKREMKSENNRFSGAESVLSLQDGGRVSPAFSYLSLKSDSSIPVPPNFSLRIPDHHRRASGPSPASFVHVEDPEEQRTHLSGLLLTDPVSFVGHGCGWQCTETTINQQSDVSDPEDLSSMYITDDIKSGELNYVNQKN